MQNDGTSDPTRTSGVSAARARDPASTEAPTAEVGNVTAAATRAESLAKWDAALDASPVFGGEAQADDRTRVTDAPTCAPAIEAVAGAMWPSLVASGAAAAPASLDVAIDTMFSVASAPAATDPAVDLLVTVTPNGPPLLDAKAGPVVHVVLALDLSASMNAEDKYPLLSRALAGMLEDLRKPGSSDVLLSVVVFAYGTEVLFREVLAKDLPPRRLLDALDNSKLRFTRYTDFVGAMNAAGCIARDSVKKQKALPVRMYVLTDGRPQDADGARTVMDKVHKLPVDVDGLSFGDDADAASMTALLCGPRGGSVKHVTAESIDAAFGKIGDFAQRVVAPRALLDLELRAGVVGGAAYRFRPQRYRYPDDSFVAGTQFATDLGTLESGRSYWMLFQVRLPVAKAGETEVGRITLRVPGFGGARIFERLVSIQRHGGSDAVTVQVAEVAAAREAVDGLDPSKTLAELRMRRELFGRDHSDRRVVEAIDRAIAEVQRTGTLATLPAADRAFLDAEVMGRRPAAAQEVRSR